MNYKVLLADDSLTIQKVIKITLANQPYDIVDCSSDDELFKKLPEVNPKLVFLDFNLSEKYTGYELTSKIKAAVPEAKVLLLLGTFDTVDESMMEKCGASDKIVKPFDSNKFISICKRLVDEEEIVEEINFPEALEEKDEFVVPGEDDQWKMNHTVEQTPVESKPMPSRPEILDVKKHLNPLDQEVSEWGMSIPSVIDDKDSHEKTIDLPPVIGEVKSLEQHRSKVEAASLKEEAKFPDSTDLDYPTVEELTSTPAGTETQKTANSKLLSIESFNQPEEFAIEHGIDSMNESDVSNIEAQIRDEVEDDLWKVDEFEDLKKEVSSKIEEMSHTFTPSTNDFDESLFKPLDEDESIQWSTDIPETKEEKPSELIRPSASREEILETLRGEMDSLIKKHVKEYMDQMFEQKVEKVTWEVVPDLAENLIRQELSKISNKILNDSN